jgi:circadian clock protein KaiB
MSGEGGTVGGPPRYRLRLFVAGNTARSQRTLANLRRLCDLYLPDRVDLEVVDIYQQPELAAQYQVVAAPTLLKLSPGPIRRAIGDLSQESRVLRTLEVQPHFAGAGEH